MSEIYGRIASVMGEIGAIAKSRNNVAQNFKFRGIDDVYNALHPLLAKYKVFSVPEILEERREERPTKNGGISTHVIMKIKYTFFTDDGSSFAAVVIGEGADHGDKASNKAMAIAHKYALLQVFAIPTEEMKDPDEDTTEFAPKSDGPKPSPFVRSAPQPPGEYVVSFGQYEGQKLDDLDPYKVRSYCEFILKKAEREKTEIRGTVKGFLEAADEWLATKGNK